MRMMRAILKSLIRLELLLSDNQRLENLSNSNSDADSWMDAIEVLDYLNISRSTFYRLQKEKIIVARKVGKRSYYFKSDLKDAFVRSGKKGKL